MHVYSHFFIVNQMITNTDQVARILQKRTPGNNTMEPSTMPHPFPQRQSGFTLIEIAIVLVIIGLLLGGILKGQELITQARIRNVANDFQSVTAAINLYQDRYRALPGDDRGAVARWTNTGDGNGNGILDGTYNTACNNASVTEDCLFWHHLRLAGLIGGANTDRTQPVNAAQGRTGVQNGGLGLVGPVICSNNLSAKIAQAIDAQFDDGDATTGTVRGNLIAGLNAFHYTQLIVHEPRERI
ncbi:prepilin-type N-terminal cleavage/methylation domain-containing protein [Thiobacillus sp. 65-1402]|uniref:prepilin-type N-terminal cleavage/methylation domain-containing protein n=1 Tax=Thiobacillus sp. 65-1402 TaxID=1895861 RepID=UPI0025D2B4C0|nr:prepilin-type N-terminal cleavage/methylation domain-containing protein [Thiobacillus sp. 65-1402]